MQKNTLYQAESTFVHRKVAGSDVLISVGAGVANFNGYITLNESASFLWEKLQKPVSASDLIRLLREEFEVSEEDARRDVLEFLWLLQNHAMVREIEDAKT